MKKVIGLLLVVFVNGYFVHAALAQESKTALVPLPSVEDFTRGKDGWGFGLGLGVEYESAYEGADEFGFEVDPAGAVQWRSGENIFFWAGEAIGWRGLRAETWLLEAIVAFDEGREEGASDDGRLDGLGDGEESVEAVLQLRHALDANWRFWLDGRVVAGDNGNLGLLGVGYRLGDQNDGTGSEFAVAVVFHDGDYANKDFGVDAAQAVASGLNETDMSGGFRSIGFNYNYRHNINENVQLFGEAVYERYGSDIEESPIARSNYEAEVGIGVVYIF